MFPAVAADHKDIFKMRQRRADLKNFFKVGLIGDNTPGLAVVHAIAEGICSEEGKQRNGDCADLIGCNMGNRGFRTLGQQNADTIPLADSRGFKRVGKLIRKFFQFPECIFFNLSFKIISMCFKSIPVF